MKVKFFADVHAVKQIEFDRPLKDDDILSLERTRKCQHRKLATRYSEPDLNASRKMRSLPPIQTNHRHLQESSLSHHHASSVLPPIRHLEQGEHYAMSGERKNSEQELEMYNYRASSQESIGNKSSLLNSYNSPKSPTLSISDCPTSDPTLNSDLQNFPHQHPLAIEDKIEEERSSAESEVRVWGCQMFRSCC